MGAHNHRLAPTEPMPGSDVAGAPTLLEELLDHAQGNPETMGNFGPRAFVVVVGRKDSFPQIQRECSHVATLTHLADNGYTIY